MACWINDRMGASHNEVDEELIDRILAELDGDEDDEHPEVSIQDESGWSLGAFAGGLLVWENVESDEPRHMTAVPRSRVKALFICVAEGDLTSVEAEDWVPGYG